MKFSKLWILVALMMLLSGCATPYAQFYQDRTGGVDITKSDSVILNPGEPKLIRVVIRKMTI